MNNSDDIPHLKYGRTYHVPWSKGVNSDDKIIHDLSFFFGKEVVITEKLDGENTSMYPDYTIKGIHARSLDSPMNWTREWVRSVQVGIAHLLKNIRLCGENMTAIHAIEYDNLISFFYIFSAWNIETNYCYSWDKTVELAEKLDLPTPKVLYRGEWNTDLFKKMFEDMDKTKSEGYTIRLVDSFHYNDFSKCLVKAVREGHVQPNSEHWLKNAKPATLKNNCNIKPSFMNKAEK